MFLSALSVLLLAGAGCGGGAAVTADQANRETDIPLRVENLRNMPQTPTENPAPAEQPTERQPAAQAEQPATAKWQRPTGFPGLLPPKEIEKKQVRISTDKGVIVFELLAKDAPKTVSNFVALARSGYFDGLNFHRVVDGFVIQGGDPLGDGTGGPGYKFADEPVTRDYDAGIVAMANAGPDTNGSQFFIVLENQPTLPKSYTIFGRVTSGLDVVRAIRKGDVMRTVAVEELPQ